MATTSQTTSVDAWVNQVLPTINNGQSAYIWLNGDSGGSAVKKAYVFFGRPFPSGATVTSATLNLYVYTAWSGAKTITAKRVTTEWTENTITYNTVPIVTATNQATTAPSSPVTGQLVTLDVTNMLADVAGGGDWFGVELTISGTSTIKFYAAENPDQTKRPSLDVVWSLAPEAPINLVPGASQAVNAARPTVAWQFDTHDHSAERTQAYSQVQVSTSTSFASPEYDSGQTANTISNFDLSAVDYSASLGTFTVTIASPAVFTKTAHGLIAGDQVKFTTTGALPTGLTAGTTYYVISAGLTANAFEVSTTSGGSAVNTSGTQSGTHTLFRFGVPDTGSRYWRVRVWDDQGNVSAYADAVNFTRQANGTLAITNPPAPASNTVAETTPPITWTLTGKTQEAYELRLYLYEGTAKKLVWRLPKTTSTSLTQNLPAGILHETDTWNIELLNWDTQDRAVTPGDPGYVTANRDFTYVRDGSPAAVTALTATEVVDSEGNATGGMKLDFTRAATPDYFAIKEDGKLVEDLDRLDPATYFTSGTSYSYTYWGSKPATSHTYEVEAVVLSTGKLRHSSGNSTQTKTPGPQGIVLSDPDDGIKVVVVGGDSLTPDLSIGEEGTTYTPVGSRRKVRVVDAVGGYEGTISGIVKNSGYRDNLLTLKGRSPKPFRLMLKDVNIKVILEEVSVAPVGDITAKDVYSVSFAFFQANPDKTFTVTGIG